MVHDTFGGPGGHMSSPDIAGFDPIFFFHHCNVDRLIAMWQYVYDPYAYSGDARDKTKVRVEYLKLVNVSTLLNIQNSSLRTLGYL